MAGKNNENIGYIGYIGCVEATKKYNSGEVQKSTKSSYKDYGGGSSSRVTETYKAGEFVDRRSGREGYREEANYKSTYKVNDKAHGVTTEGKEDDDFYERNFYDSENNERRSESFTFSDIGRDEICYDRDMTDSYHYPLDGSEAGSDP
ncbi:hypothetical protein K7X08_022358 [Anisodus acutangulus]|uniref:Uncharacterized protein n=1 Tax=Anisodus acutangulus TaxID=402998 RepID=A0A9Q1MHU1_9SOLA|nr:hypothetical protein K7X08_022358 [Anisodus acutangulus]